LDLTVLRLLKTRDKYERLAKSIPPRALDVKTAILLADFGRFFREFPDVQAIEPAAFSVFFASIHNSVSMTDEAHAVYRHIIKDVVEGEVDEALEQGLMARLVAAAAAVETADLIAKYTAGDEVDLAQGLQSIIDNYNTQVDRKVKNPQVLDPIEDLLKEEEDDTGFHWRMGCLNRHIKPIRGGDFIVIAARPDKGKTSLIASEATHWAAQVDGLFPGERRSIMWLNNEGPGKNIVKRCFQAALNATTEKLVEYSKAGTIRQQYAEALGGRGGTLRVFDIHGMNNVEVEDLIRLHKPAIVIFDMIDNVNFLGMTLNNGQRTDQLLEAMYQWARLLGVKYDCGMVATSQISADGDGQQYPTLPMLKDSKTGKQGAADVIITMGTVNDETMADYRYMGCTKNKRGRTGKSNSPLTSVMFDRDRSRFVENE